MTLSLGFQREISKLTYLLSGSRAMLGRAGELLAQTIIEANGCQCDIEHIKFKGDLRVVTPSGCVLRVEVKTARQSKRGDWQFNLYKKSRAGIHTDCTGADAVLLIAVRPSGMCHLFLVPCLVLFGRSSIKMCDPQHKAHQRYGIYRQFIDSLSFDEIERLTSTIAL